MTPPRDPAFAAPTPAAPTTPRWAAFFDNYDLGTMFISTSENPDDLLVDNLPGEVATAIVDAHNTEARSTAPLDVEELTHALAYSDRTDDNPSRWYSGEVTYLDYEDHARAVLTGLALLRDRPRHHPNDNCGDPQHDAILQAWYERAEKLIAARLTTTDEGADHE